MSAITEVSREPLGDRKLDTNDYGIILAIKPPSDDPEGNPSVEVHWALNGISPDLALTVVASVIAEMMIAKIEGDLPDGETEEVDFAKACLESGVPPQVLAAFIKDHQN